MDCVSVSVFTEPGRPAAVGHFGTVITHPPNKDGKILVEFTLRRKGMRHLRQDGYRKLDKRKRKDQDT